MSEIKIEERRFLQLIEIEKQYPNAIYAVIEMLIFQWKKNNPFKTREDREPCGLYVSSHLKEFGIKIENGFPNTYKSVIQFWVNGDYYNVPIAEINTSTGLSIENKQ